MRALVVGLGRMGRFHRFALQDLGYEVDAVDPDVTTGAEYRSIQEGLMGGPSWRAARYDVACVATPAEHLVESAFQLAGLPMLVEKPFATNAQEAAMLAAYLESKGAPIAVGFVERFNPRLRELRERIAGRQSTKARFIRWSDRPSENVMLDLLTHDVDLARHLGLDWSSTNGRAWDRVIFETKAHQDRKVRRIEVEIMGPTWSEAGLSHDGELVWANLLDHGQSPLHALWHAFLTHAEETPRPADAVAAILGAQRVTERDQTEVEA